MEEGLSAASSHYLGLSDSDWSQQIISSSAITRNQNNSSPPHQKDYISHPN